MHIRSKSLGFFISIIRHFRFVHMWHYFNAHFLAGHNRLNSVRLTTFPGTIEKSFFLPLKIS